MATGNPNSNFLDIQADAFEEPSKANGSFKFVALRENPIRVGVDPDEFVERVGPGQNPKCIYDRRVLAQEDLMWYQLKIEKDTNTCDACTSRQLRPSKE